MAAKPQQVEKVVETTTIDKKILKEQLVPLWLKEFRNITNNGHSEQK